MTFYKNAFSLATNKNIQVVSFDFFDTLMHRNVENPVDVFVALGEHLLGKKMLPINISAERFKAYRVKAEVDARSKAKNREVKIIDIYKELQCVVDGIKISNYVREEIDVEHDSLRVVATIINLLQVAKKDKKKVIIVSDTYFDAETLNEFLPKKYSSLIDKIYTSSDLGMGKGSGSFNYVIKDQEIDPSKFLHMGDNYIADVEIPSKLGIVSILMPNGTNEIAQIRERELQINAQRNSLQKGGARSHLITQEVKVAHLFEVNNPWSHQAYGMYVLGPIYTAFVKWLLERVESTSSKHVLMMMREGFLLEKIAQVIGPKGFTVGKIFLSRKILFKASLDRLTLADVRFACGNPMSRSISGSANLLNLSVDEFLSALKMNEEIDINKISSEEVYALLNSNKKTIKLISSRAKSQRLEVLEHLQSLVGIDKSPNISLVDLGWNTTIQALLYKCLLLEGLTPKLNGYYLLTTGSANEYDNQGSMSEGFLVNGGFPEFDFSLLSRNLEILEQVCVPNHGTLIGFENGKPIVEAAVLPPKQLAEIQDVQSGILNYAKFYVMNNPEKHFHSNQDIAYLSNKLIRAMLNPTSFEVSMFDEWLHDENLFTNKTRNLMDIEFVDNVKYKTIESLKNTPMTEVYWPAGAVAKNSQNLSKLYLYSFLNGLSFDFFENAFVKKMKVSFLREGVDLPESAILMPVSSAIGGGALYKFKLDKDIVDLSFSIDDVRGFIVDRFAIDVHENNIVIRSNVTDILKKINTDKKEESLSNGDFVKAAESVVFSFVENTFSLGDRVVTICVQVLLN